MNRKKFTDNFNLLKEIIIYDQDRNQINAADTDWLVVRGGVLRDIFYGISSRMGAKGNAALVEIGTIVGNNFASEQLERGMRPDEIPTILSLLLNQGGWGKVTVELDAALRKGKIVIENCVISRHTKADEPNCYFLKGYFKGLLEALVKVEVDCVETTCIAKGDSVCQFEINSV